MKVVSALDSPLGLHSWRHNVTLAVNGAALVALVALLCLGTQQQHGTAMPEALTLAHSQTQVLAAAQPPHWAMPALDDAGSTISNATLQAILRRLATMQEDAVIFTTFAAHRPEALDMLRNMCAHLQLQGLLRHTLLITSDEGSWRRARQAGLPAYLDRASPTQQRRAIYLFQKHWLAARILELNHSVLFMDADAVVLGDALQPLRTRWELQGLSDWRTGPHLPRTGGANAVSCGLYAVTNDARIQPRGGAILHPMRRLNSSAAHDIPVPCQSTGFWYARPTPQTVAFLNAVVQRIYWDASWQWEQAAWNDLLPAFLFGMGDEPPVWYRILPVDQYSNIGIYRERMAAGLPMRAVAVHAGYIRGTAVKIRQLKELGMWRA